MINRHLTYLYFSEYDRAMADVKSAHKWKLSFLEFDQKRNVRQVFLLLSSSIFCVDISDECPKQSQSQLCPNKLWKPLRKKIFFVYKFSLLENIKHNWIIKNFWINHFIFTKIFLKIFLRAPKNVIDSLLTCGNDVIISAL